MRTVEWPKEIGEEEDAREAGIRANATLVIWGEYDSGRVIARFTVPSDGAASQATAGCGHRLIARRASGDYQHRADRRGCVM